MAIVTLMNDHQEDLYEFVINHVGVTAQESEVVCETTRCALVEFELEKGLDELSLSHDNSEKKQWYCQKLTSTLGQIWAKMGFSELKIRTLIRKFIPFVVSVIMYKIEERRYEREEMYLSIQD